MSVFYLVYVSILSCLCQYSTFSNQYPIAVYMYTTVYCQMKLDSFAPPVIMGGDIKEIGGNLLTLLAVRTSMREEPRATNTWFGCSAREERSGCKLVEHYIRSGFICFLCSDINACDKHGRSALHLVASSESVHARKMVSLLMRNGSTVGE